MVCHPFPWFAIHFPGLPSNSLACNPYSNFVFHFLGLPSISLDCHPFPTLVIHFQGLPSISKVCHPFPWFAIHSLVCHPFPWFAIHFLGLSSISLVCHPFPWFAIHLLGLPSILLRHASWDIFFPELYTSSFAWYCTRILGFSASSSYSLPGVELNILIILYFYCIVFYHLNVFTLRLHLYVLRFVLEASIDVNDAVFLNISFSAAVGLLMSRRSSFTFLSILICQGGVLCSILFVLFPGCGFRCVSAVVSSIGRLDSTMLLVLISLMVLLASLDHSRVVGMSL